jgi:hypothetical protein
MTARALSYGLAAVAALLVLPAIEALFYFVISGGPQSLRGGFEPGHVSKYIGIFFYTASLTMLVVAASAAVVLLLAKLSASFNAAFIVLVSAPVAVAAAHVAALVLEPDDFPLPLGIWIVAMIGGVVASGTFCAFARVPLRAAPARTEGAHA